MKIKHYLRDNNILIFLFVFYLITLNSCSGKDENVSSNELYQRALVLCNNLDINDSNKVNNIIDLCNESINLDNKNYDPYNILLILFLKKKDYFASIDLLNKAITMFPENDLSFINLGIIYEKIGKREQALKVFNQLLDNYNKRLSQQKENIKILADIAFLKIFLEGKSEAILEINNLKKQYPRDPYINVIKNNIEFFDINIYLGYAKER